jgi:hypothetical protein
LTIKEAIEIVEDIGFYVPLLDSQKEALEKLISNAEATRWVKLTGDLSMLFDLDPTRYKINKEDWIADKAIPLDEFLDELYEDIKR